MRKNLDILEIKFWCWVITDLWKEVKSKKYQCCSWIVGHRFSFLVSTFTNINCTLGTHTVGIFPLFLFILYIIYLIVLSSRRILHLTNLTFHTNYIFQGCSYCLILHLKYSQERGYILFLMYLIVLSIFEIETMRSWSYDRRNIQIFLLLSLPPQS